MNNIKDIVFGNSFMHKMYNRLIDKYAKDFNKAQYISTKILNYWFKIKVQLRNFEALNEIRSRM